MSIQIDPTVKSLIQQTSLPDELGFGKYFSPLMASARFRDNKWQDLQLVPYSPLILDPATMVFHYGQSIFEGMKAYRNKDSLHLFRPWDHARRFQTSAIRMAMPELPVDFFMEAVTSFSRESASLVPEDDQATLYLRPFIFADQVGLGVKPSQSYHFLVIGSPSGQYFADQAVQVMIERTFYRAASLGGTGAVKTAGNYACSLLSDQKAKRAGYHQSLWLDSKTGKHVEEMTGMNFFVVREGKLVTPPLSNSILAGITRDTLFYLAKDLQLEVSEQALHIDEVIGEIESGKIEECFICGTAAGVTPVKLLGEEDGKRYPLAATNGPVTQLLRKTLAEAQRGQRPLPEEWIVKV